MIKIVCRAVLGVDLIADLEEFARNKPFKNIYSLKHGNGNYTIS